MYACVYVYDSKLKELSKRTTFIRVSAQINEVYGSTDEGRKAAPPPPTTTSTNAAAASSSSSPVQYAEGPDAKRVKGEKE